MLPPSVSEVGQRYGDLQENVSGDAFDLLDQALRRGRKSPEAWRDAVQSIGNRLLLLQVLAASYAEPFLNDVLEAQDADGSSVGEVVPESYSDLTDGGGSWLQALVYAPNSVRETTSNADMWTHFEFVAKSIVKTGLGDTARAAVQSGMFTRPAVRWYVRMLKGTSCARCIILAGKRSKRVVAFDRHKRCDCVNIPAAEDSGDWSTNPHQAFKRLSVADQDRLFTQSGAKAIRMGADPAQIVNARKGISVVDAYGVDVERTLEGTTKRGIAGKRLGDEGYSKTVGLKSSKYAYARTPRILPDQIFRWAEESGWDDAEVLRQLRRFAYVI